MVVVTVALGFNSPFLAVVLAPTLSHLLTLVQTDSSTARSENRVLLGVTKQVLIQNTKADAVSEYRGGAPSTTACSMGSTRSKRMHARLARTQCQTSRQFYCPS